MITLITLVHMLALGQMEGGSDNIAKHGAAGEITRYQVLPRELHAHGYGTADVETHKGARIVCRNLWQERVNQFEARQQRPATVQELYLLWHRPARVLHPRAVERERAVRFENLYRSVKGEVRREK